MMILAHRGWWTQPSEKNTLVAFSRAFDAGFGIETDIRDGKGRLVVSHDMPRGDEPALADLLHLLGQRRLPVAINVKSDGLAPSLHDEMATAGIRREDWFAFDMSIPDMRAHLRASHAVFGRRSEVERDLPWADALDGIWLDGFDGVWYDVRAVESLLARHGRVCVVSEDLHGRDAAAQWSMLSPLSSSDGLMLCTDHPLEARHYFQGKAHS